MVNEVVGNGLFAKAFASSQSDECLFFCSGVSKSTEVDPKQFAREANLLRKYLKEEKCVVYFSSVLAPTKQNDYYDHKLNMEELVRSLAKTYLIIRLPQVAGAVLNDTLLPSFIKKIYLNQSFEIYKNAPRSIIDVDDVVIFFDLIYNDNVRNKTINFCPGYNFQPQELANIISSILGKYANYKFVDKESIQHCDQSEVLKKYNYVLGDLNTYLERVVKKYAYKIVAEIELNKGVIMPKNHGVRSKIQPSKRNQFM